MNKTYNLLSSILIFVGGLIWGMTIREEGWDTFLWNAFLMLALITLITALANRRKRRRQKRIEAWFALLKFVLNFLRYSGTPQYQRKLKPSSGMGGMAAGLVALARVTGTPATARETPQPSTFLGEFCGSCGHPLVECKCSPTLRDEDPVAWARYHRDHYKLGCPNRNCQTCYPE